MFIKRLTVAAALVSALICGTLQARTSQPETRPAAAMPLATSHDSALLQSLPAFNPMVFPGQLVAPGVGAVSAGTAVTLSAVEKAAAAQPVAVQPAADTVAIQNITDLRKALLAAAMSLRDIRYVRGGHDPTTGFDCSDFVRYVFAHAVGMQLPTNAAGQFMAGLKVKRADMQPGDLVFFHTHGRHRISHVGIYISNGRFIHSPTTGKSVEISSLDNGYWAKRFAGAKRPEAMAMAAKQG